MNNVLVLKGKFDSKPNTAGGGGTNLPVGATVSVEHIQNLKRQLERILVFWNKTENQIISGALVSVHYRSVIAKSNRLKYLLGISYTSPNDSIRGSKFVWEKSDDSAKKQKHVFTHFVTLQELEKNISCLDNVIKIVSEKYDGIITPEITKDINNGKYSDKRIAKTNFLKIAVDCYFVESFDVDTIDESIDNESIVTLYRTGVSTKELLRKIGIDVLNAEMLDDTTIRLLPEEISILQEHAPYLIAMAVKNFAEIDNCAPEIHTIRDGILSLPSPTNEPTIGVIDTHFDESVYFSEWVEYHNELSPDIEIETKDKEHGTAVSSIIVDGPTFNKRLDDECGRFKVRHFGVAKSGGFSSFTVLKLIRKIVAENTDIKVWNLSLGSAMEIQPNFISPEAAELDRIQNEYDVIFVVAGTNKPKGDAAKRRIGAPADSLNSLVVNAVDFKKNPASYTRTGPVLSFFNKPDVSYYGGDKNDKIIVCEPLGGASVTGTSYAAPWIARKIAYLIHIMGMSREIAKALIIDAAAKWDRKDNMSHDVGFGVVPIKISEIIQSENDEIKFIMTGAIDEYETFTYNLPVPVNSKGYPFFAKATLAYFPKCDRNQGVDYTSTEMDIHFGRIYEQNGKPAIKSIDCNRQADDGRISLYEEDARKLYRKWDNVKHISEKLNSKARPRKIYESNIWGLSIKTKERLQPKSGKGLQFGVVVTLKEMDGINRISEFIKLAQIRGWVVSQLDVHNQIEVYNKAEETISFD